MRNTRLIILALCLFAAPLSAVKAEDCDDSIGRYTSASWGFSTNSFWIEGPTGVVLIDTQFLPSAAKEAVEIAESYTGKKVVLAIVLHANPDKFNGTQYLTSRGIQVVTSHQVRDLIPDVDALRRKWFYDRYKPDYPDKLVLPENFGSEPTVIEAAGLKLTMHLFGQAVSRAHVVVELDHHLFVGDLMANKHHGWMEFGDVDAWIGVLDQLKELHARYIHPGRGYESGAGLLDQQIEYLRFVQSVVESHKPKGEIPDKVKEEIIGHIKEKYVGYGNEYFLELGVPAVWKHLALSPRSP